MRLKNTKGKISLALGAVATVGALFPSPVGAASDWSLYEYADKLTDKRITTASTSYSVDRLERRISVRCTDTKLEVIINMGEFLGTAEVGVKYRVDKLPLVVGPWTASTDGTAIFAPDNSELARLLMKGSEFIIEAYDFRGHPYRANFTLHGSSQTIRTVLENCGRPTSGFQLEGHAIRKEIAKELDRWGPKSILVSKQILGTLGYYKGIINGTIEPAFASAVQSFYDDYTSRCSAKKVYEYSRGSSCYNFRSALEFSIPAFLPTAGAVIYESAPTQYIHEREFLRRYE